MSNAYRLKNAPAFQLYAANELADRRFREMTLAERGLWITLHMECWVNKTVPADAQKMARWLGVSVSEIENACSELVLCYFKRNGDHLLNPDLEKYRTKLERARSAMSEGGEEGARRRKNKKNDQGYPATTPERNLEGYPATTLEGTHKGPSLDSSNLNSAPSHGGSFTEGELT